MRIPLILLLSVFILPSVGNSLPSDSLKERVRCGYCHVNKAGGGPRNPRGIYYSKHGSLGGYREPGLPSRKPPVLLAKPSVPEKRITEPAKRTLVAKAGQPKEVIPPKVVEEQPQPPAVEITKLEPSTPWTERVVFGADLRLWFNGSRINGAPRKFGLDQVEPSVSVDLNPSISAVFAYNFANPLLTAYGEYDWRDAYFRVGSFHVPIGLPYYDYTALLKDRYDIGVDTRDVGIELGYAKDINVQLAFVNGAREPNRFGLPPFYMSDNDFGTIGNVSYRGALSDVAFLAGTSVLFERRVPPGVNPPGEVPAVVLPGTTPPGPISAFDDNTTRASTFIWDSYLHAQIKQFDFLGEVALGQNTPYVINGDPKDSFALLGEISYRLNDKWRLLFRYDHFIEDRRFTGTYVQRFVPSVFWQFAEYASATLQYRNTSLKGNAIPFLTAPAARNDNVLLLFHFWL